MELLNLFDLEDAEMHFPSVTLFGISSMGELVAQLVRAWLPHIKHTQVPHLVSGITPVRSVVNLGSGLADLVLLPLQSYRTKGRLVQGLRKGATSFLHSASLESARLGSRLAVGAQVLLEHAEDIFENDPLRDGERSETLQLGIASTSKYSAPPADVAEGISAAYRSLSGHAKQAAQTIIAVPVEVYERKGPTGAAKAVLRAMPVAILRPMIGAAEALSKTLIGVEGSLAPERGAEIKLKYKSRHDRYPEDDWFPPC